MKILNTTTEQVASNKFVPSVTEIHDNYRKEVSDLIQKPFISRPTEEVTPLNPEKLQELCKKQKQFKTADKITDFVIGVVFWSILVTGILAGITATAFLSSLLLLPVCVVSNVFCNTRSTTLTNEKHVHSSKNFEDFAKKYYLVDKNYVRERGLFDFRLHTSYSRWKKEVKALDKKITAERRRMVDTGYYKQKL